MWMLIQVVANKSTSEVSTYIPHDKELYKRIVRNKGLKLRNCDTFVVVIVWCKVIFVVTHLSCNAKKQT